MARQDELRDLVATHARRLRRLQEQAAYQGIHTPPAVLMEIEDIQRQVAELQVELGAQNAMFGVETPVDLAAEISTLKRLLADISAEPRGDLPDPWSGSISQQFTITGDNSTVAGRDINISGGEWKRRKPKNSKTE